MLPVLWLLILVSCGLYALKYYTSSEKRRLLELTALVPRYKGYLPIVGHAFKLVGSPEHRWELVRDLAQATEDAGGVMTLWLGFRLLFIINDPDDALTLMNSCLKKNDVYRMGERCFGAGLLYADVDTWRRTRKLLSPTFSQHVLDRFLDTFNQQSALLVQGLEPLAGTGEFDAQELIKDIVLETVCRTTLGISQDDGSMIDRKYKDAMETELGLLMDRLCAIWLHNDFIYSLSPTKKLEDETVKTMHNMSKNIMYKRRAERQQQKQANISSRRYIAFLDLLLDMAEDGLFTDEEIQQELHSMIAAGYDTTSKALITILLLLGSYPDVQEKMYDEIMSVLGSSTFVDTDDIKKLVFTEAVIKEALRVSTIAPVVARDIEKEVKLKNYTLPAGSGCVVSLWGINRLPMWGPDRFEFRPERWLDPASLPQNAGAFCSFSIGRRGCIGKTYALMSVKTTLVHLVRKFRITADFRNVKLQYKFLISFAAGHHLSLELRN